MKDYSTSTRSIFEELNSYVPIKDKDDILKARSERVITSIINLLEYVHENYTEEEAVQLEKRFMSSIRCRDPERFMRGVVKIKENRNEKTDSD